MSPDTLPAPRQARPLILASGSPRRAQLLGQINLVFDVIRPDIDETPLAGEAPAAYVRRMSTGKVAAATQLVAPGSTAVLLCADTIVVLDGRILGKPADEADAIAMLMAMSGVEHEVLTDVTLTDLESRRQDSFMVSTRVLFRTLDEAECRRYWRTGEPADKSGSYGIQGLGAVFVDAIHGSSSNVAGLPLRETADWLKRYGIDCLATGGQGS